MLTLPVAYELLETCAFERLFHATEPTAALFANEDPLLGPETEHWEWQIFVASRQSINTFFTGWILGIYKVITLLNTT
jgi:hypothetical protein